ncbi:MAG: oxygen-independent coproporphyrinogen oxidase [Myxococcales bacterium]|nr:oxygen-independent coproporphyrinogen oxidase [Myxococcales bacterium]
MNITAGDLARFSIEAPRYTSYPTAAEFQTAVGVAAYRDALRAAGGAGAGAGGPPLSLYVHLPFCRAVCHFCGCHALVARTSERIDRYRQALTHEMSTVAQALGRARPVGELHFGGGSPSLLEPDTFASLMADLRATFPFAPDAAISLEADPRTTDGARLQRYKDLGVRRLSFGFQDFDPRVQRAIGRNQSAEVSKTAYAQARAVGFDSINVDLCYGLPEQTEEGFARTVDEVITLGPDRIAIFGYAHVPWMKPMQRRMPIATLPGTALRLRLMAGARAALLAAGYRAIGLDHFARPGDALTVAMETGRLHRNFQGYTTTATDTLIGLGLSAISELPGGYFQNQRDLGDYQRTVADGNLATERGVLRSHEDLLRGEIIRALMCNFRIDVGAIEQHFGVDFAEHFADELEELQALARQGLVRQDGIAICLTPLGTVFVRNVARVFDAHRRAATAAAADARFSQTA